MRSWNRRFMRRAATGLAAIVVAGGLASLVRADSTYQALPFSQSWPTGLLITTDNDWSGVPGILGYATVNQPVAAGADPQLLTADVPSGAVPVVLANQNGPDGLTWAAVAEFEDHATELDGNEVVGIRPQTDFPAPHLLIHLNTTGVTNVRVQYTLRDLEDNSGHDSIQPVALQYRVGTSGPFVNVPEAFVPDATVAAAKTSTLVDVVLPAAANNQAQVQLRIISANAAVPDEWVGIDDLSITGSGSPPDPGTLTNRLFLPSLRRN